MFMTTVVLPVSRGVN